MGPVKKMISIRSESGLNSQSFIMFTMKNIKNIIWDFDGTLFDTYPAITRSFQHALSDLGHDMPLSLFYDMVRVSLDHTLEQLNALFQVDEAALKERFYAHYTAVAPEAQPPFDGAREVCELIKEQGGKNFLVTHRRKASAVKLLEHYSMVDLFCDYIFKDDGYTRKPDPEMFDLLIKKHKLVRSETIAIGDRDLDIGAGKAAGVRTCLYVKIEEALKGSHETICDYRLLIREIEKEVR